MELTKKEQVIKWLKEFNRLSTSRFVGLLSSDYNFVKKLLDEMLEEGLVVKEVETNSTFWKLKEVSDGKEI